MVDVAMVMKVWMIVTCQLTQVMVIYTKTLTVPGNKPLIFSLASSDRLLSIQPGIDTEV